MTLPLTLSTGQILKHFDIGLTAWNDIRTTYHIKPVTRAKGGYIYRGIDIANALTATNPTDKIDDAIMKGLNSIG